MHRRPSLSPGRLALAALLALASTPAPRAASVAPAPDTSLVTHIEDAGGDVLESQYADRPFNPASVVKLATTLRALEQLGPDHRFDTRFVVRGSLDPTTGRLTGDLLVLGGGDPDFHWENAFLVARSLATAGVREVTGRLLVDDRFWIGWEGGSERRERDPERRAAQMAARMRTALDPRRWPRDVRRVWDAFAVRQGLGASPPARIGVLGSAGRLHGEVTESALLVHRSKTLLATLKRLNAYSNNDIERLEVTIGGAADMQREYAERWEAPAGSVRFDTLSGLGTNRMTPRLVVRLLRELAQTCRRLDCAIDEVLPVAGCDPGTLRHFPTFARGEATGALAGKTGTLTTTDGGVSVLAGFVNTAEGERLFCVAVPRSGYDTRAARATEQRWLLRVVRGNGGPRPYRCGPEVADPAAGAEVYAF